MLAFDIIHRHHSEVRMKLYQFSGTGEIKVVEREIKDNNEIKLKVSKIIPTSYDHYLFSGKVKANYPIVPCSMATAIISEDNETYNLKRGQKVILNPFFKTDEESDEYEMYSKEKDGFFCDFIDLPKDNIMLLDEVKEDDGLFLCYVAKALAILDELKLEKGDYVSVVGGSPIMNILCQLILYYQGIPILIANDDKMLKKAQENGVYYTINEFSESPTERVKAITGGRFSEHSVFLASEITSPNYMFDLVKDDGKVVIMGDKESISRIEINVSAIFKKGLNVVGITEYQSKIDAALNTLMQNTLQLSNLCDKTVSCNNIKEVEKLFNQISENPIYYYCPVIEI